MTISNAFDLGFLLDGGDMGRRIAAFDWSATPLGPMENWPVPLVAAMKVMQLTPLPMYMAWGSDLTLIYNDTYAATIPEKHPAALGQPIRKVWEGDAWGAVAPQIEGALEGRPSFVRDKPHPLGCGPLTATRYYNCSSVPLSDETGQVRGIFCTGYETTAEVRTREAFKADSERLRDLFAQAPGFMVVLTGPQHTFEIVNDAYYGLVGHRELIGKSVLEALPEVEGQGYLELLDGVYATGKPHIANEASVTLRRTPNGPGEARIVTFIYQPIRNAQGLVTGIFVEGSDVTDAVQASARQKEIERLAHATIDALGEHLAVIDEDGRILTVNKAWRTFASSNGAAATAVSEGANYLAACAKAADDGDTIAREVAGMIGDIAAGSRTTAEIQYPCHSPTEQRWFHLRVSRFSDEGPTRIVVSHEDITARRKSEERIEYLATHDALTGLPNRNLLEDRAQQVIEHSQRSGLGAALLFLDLDNFKYLNDAFGHAVGDEVLVAVAKELGAIVLPGDTIARLGGDELVILLTDLNNPAVDAGKVANAITQRFASPLPLDDRDITVTASIGVSVYPDDGQNLEELLKNADAAMYRAKAVGRSSYQFYTAEMSARANERVLLENELRRAIPRDQFRLVYQPKVAMRTGKTIGVEALIRWKHPELGDIAPNRFIPVAEEAGLIGEIGRYVMRTASFQMRSWQRAGLPLMPVAVNVSAAQLRHPDFVDTVRSILAETGLDPSLLELEITENIVMDRSETLTGRLHDLRRLGVSLSMDDFGTGYSNLAYLQEFPLGRLKIDRCFVQELTTSSNAGSIVRAILALGKSLGLKVLAEGVETVEQANALIEMGCEEAQGFLYSYPLSPVEVDHWLRRSSASQGTTVPHPMPRLRKA